MLISLLSSSFFFFLKGHPSFSLSGSSSFQRRFLFVYCFALGRFDWSSLFPRAGLSPATPGEKCQTRRLIPRHLFYNRRPFRAQKTQEEVRTLVPGYYFLAQSSLTSRQSEISSTLPVDPVARHAATGGMTAAAAFGAVLSIERAARRLGAATGRTS